MQALAVVNVVLGRHHWTGFTFSVIKCDISAYFKVLLSLSHNKRETFIKIFKYFLIVKYKYSTLA